MNSLRHASRVCARLSKDGDALPRRILLLFGSGLNIAPTASSATESPRLTALTSKMTGQTEFVVISLGLDRSIPGATHHIRLPANSLSAFDRAATALGAFRLRRRFSTFPLGRLLNSIGPVDQGRVFWRSVRRHPEALTLLKSSTSVIATDLPAVKAAWIAVRRGWVESAFYEHQAASVGIAFPLPGTGEVG